MEGIITKGTTIRGGHVNEGDRVTVSDDDYNQLLSTGDIRPINESDVVAKKEEAPAEKSSPKPKSKKAK